MDAPGPRPADAFDGLTYGGESVVEAVTVSGGTVGVTTHRVLALTPGGSGPNLAAIALPNVDSIAVSTAGDARHGFRALRYGVYALALLVASVLVDFEGTMAIDPPDASGAGQVANLAVATTTLLSIVDDVIRAAGIAVLLGALGFAALYGYSRDRYLEIEVAGADPVDVPLRTNEPVAAERLEVAVERASTDDRGSLTTVGGEKASNPSAG